MRSTSRCTLSPQAATWRDRPAPPDLDAAVEFTATRDGTAHGLGGWFVAELTESRMSTGFRHRAWQVLAVGGTPGEAYRISAGEASGAWYELYEKKEYEPALAIHQGMRLRDLAQLIQDLTDQMREAATELQFELAARLRDQLLEVKAKLGAGAGSSS